MTKYTTLIPGIDSWQGMIPCQADYPVYADVGRHVVARSPPVRRHVRRGRIDAPITIRALKRFVTEKYGVESMEPDTQYELRFDGGDVGNKQRWRWLVRQQSRAT